MTRRQRLVNLGIAAATPRGLVVPNIKDADSLSMTELAAALGQLTATARDGKTQPAEMAGGTFTITNVGVFGVDAGTPIINPGESGILCFGAINKRPWVDEETGENVVRDVTTLALSFDHRHIDGEKGSRFLADVAGNLPIATLTDREHIERRHRDKKVLLDLLGKLCRDEPKVSAALDEAVAAINQSPAEVDALLEALDRVPAMFGLEVAV